MGCASCGSKDGSVKGCNNNGNCSTGGCNKRNTFDWLSHLDLHDPTETDLVEVSFKKGARKDFYHNPQSAMIGTGNMVVVDTGSGFDIGKITLSGELVRMQMKKKRVPEDRITNRVIRVANNRDLERLQEARMSERNTLIRARAISRTLDLDMKIGDVEYQGDRRKATFYYTAEGRIDFRELVRNYAKEFRVKIEMRQIGSRQESARIGGLGSCGRELCCSTWLSDFKSVSTTAARYQNIAINQAKLSGQCGRLKCCLNYELDTYMEALEGFPKKANVIKLKNGKAELIKTNIFKGIMYYSQMTDRARGPMIALDKDKVIELLEMNKNGEFPDDLRIHRKEIEIDFGDQEPDVEFADVTGVIELPSIKKKRRNSRKPRGGKNKRRDGSRGPKSKRGDSPRGKSNKGGAAKGQNTKGAEGKPKSNNRPERKPKTDRSKEGGENRGPKKPQNKKSKWKKSKRSNNPKGQAPKKDNNPKGQAPKKDHNPKPDSNAPDPWDD